MTMIGGNWRRPSERIPVWNAFGKATPQQFTAYFCRDSIRGMRNGFRVLLALLASRATFAADAQRIRAAAEKGLALIQLSQKGWNRDCVSCHQQILPAFALQAAREHGIKFDETAARQQAARAFSLYANLDRAIEYTHIVDPAMDTAFNL